MIRTITDYVPGIYGEIERRIAARADREARIIAALDRVATWLLWSLILGCALFCPWLLYTLSQQP